MANIRRLSIQTIIAASVVSCVSTLELTSEESFLQCDSGSNECRKELLEKSGLRKTEEYEPLHSHTFPHVSALSATGASNSIERWHKKAAEYSFFSDLDSSDFEAHDKQGPADSQAVSTGDSAKTAAYTALALASVFAAGTAVPLLLAARATVSSPRFGRHGSEWFPKRAVTLASRRG